MGFIKETLTLRTTKRVPLSVRFEDFAFINDHRAAAAEELVRLRRELARRAARD